MDYFEVPFLSASGIKEYSGETRFFKGNKEEIFYFGEQFHRAVLEPSTIDVNYEKLGLVYTMRDAILKDTLTRQILMHPQCKIEHEYYKRGFLRGVLNDDGYNVKCKFDAVVKPLKLGFELKGLNVGSQEGLMHAIINFGYDLSAAWYMDIAGIEKHLIISVSKAKPHQVFKYLVQKGDAVYNSGKYKYMQILKTL